MRRYGQWSGRPNGTPEDKTRCVATVMSGMIGCQCRRPRGHGKDGLFCKQHAKKPVGSCWVPEDEP